MNCIRLIFSWIRDPNNLTAISTAVIAAFTIILAGVGYCQARLIRKSINLARAEFNATHRPKIRIHVAEFKHLPPKIEGDSNRAGASVLCFNVGESAAMNVEVRGQIFAGSNFSIDVQRPLIMTVPKLESGIKLRFTVESD